MSTQAPTLGHGNPEPPGIAPRSDGDGPRPFWSVALPVYRANPAFFEAPLKSVLDQDPGADRMENLISDDDPSHAVARQVADRLAPRRVGCHANASNLGLAGNWNACIGRARGRWIHLLHQDDWVSPGFYEALARCEAEAPECVAAFTRYSLADARGHWTCIGELERPEAGVLEGWLERIASAQRIQCAAIAVKRSTYEAIGGYRTDLVLALDWEMWVRIAAHGPVWYEPSILAHFRSHGASETDRLMRDGRTGADVLRAREIVRAYVPASLRADVAREIVADFVPQAPPTRSVMGRARRLARELTPPVLWRSLSVLSSRLGRGRSGTR